MAAIAITLQSGQRERPDFPHLDSLVRTNTSL